MVFGFYADPAEAPLPHPPISLAVFLVVEEAMRKAWNLLRTDPHGGFDLVNATENVVTHEFHEALCDRVFAQGLVNGFDARMFTTITRDSKVRNYDGTLLDKMPDLLIGLVGRKSYRQTQDWLFVECKPVDASHSLVTHYCDRGVRRFVRGDYAWTMTSALMIGYTRGGYTISPKLVDALLSRRNEITTLDTPVACSRSTATSVSEPVHITRHVRTFRYAETQQPAPAIIIRHLWLRRD